jgi:hypothetical protein
MSLYRRGKRRESVEKPPKVGHLFNLFTSWTFPGNFKNSLINILGLLVIFLTYFGPCGIVVLDVGNVRPLQRLIRSRGRVS